MVGLIYMFKSSLWLWGREGGAQPKLGTLCKRWLLEDVGFEVQKLVPGSESRHCQDRAGGLASLDMSLIRGGLEMQQHLV